MHVLALLDVICPFKLFDIFSWVGVMWFRPFLMPLYIKLTTLAIMIWLWLYSRLYRRNRIKKKVRDHNYVTGEWRRQLKRRITELETDCRLSWKICFQGYFRIVLKNMFSEIFWVGCDESQGEASSTVLGQLLRERLLTIILFLRKALWTFLVPVE